MRSGGRVQFKPEHTSYAYGTFHADGAAHEFDQSLAHHEADASALFRAGFSPQPIE